MSDTGGGRSLKNRLVEVTIDLLLEPRDVRLPTMREIAGKAEVAPGAAYRHFESQADLLLAVVTELFGRLEAHLVEAAAGGADPGATVRAIAHAYVSWGLSNLGAYQLLLETTDTADVLASAERPGLHLIDQLAHLLARHHNSEVPQFEEATGLWVALHGLVSLRAHKTGMRWSAEVQTDVDRFLDLFLNVNRDEKKPAST